METRSGSEAPSGASSILSVLVVVLAIAAGSLWYAYSGLKTQLAQQREAQRALETERDGLKTASRSQRERITTLEAKNQALQGKLDEQVNEVQRLHASAAEALMRYQVLEAEKDALSRERSQALEQAQAIASARDGLSSELDATKKALAQAHALASERNLALEQLQQDTQARLQSLDAEKAAINQQLSAARDQATSAAAAGERLTRELASARQALGETQAAVAKQKAAFAQLQDEHARLETADLERQAELRQLQQAQRDAQQKLQALEAENTSIAHKLASTQGQAQAAATAGASLSSALDSTRQTLALARSRAADLNQSYQELLKDHSNLAATGAVRKAELDRMRAAFEAAQNEVARLTGARGIYTVQAADSLSSIAAYFYRNGNRWTDIQRENAFLAGNPDLIYAGQVLIIPK
ncbi:LysM peptidoglycan-binding domain-containing protein [Comamonadaceae bacterium G21597-S1]|nr:LysM peptidoglycan-binding domain-containing protein [Comamonadaceae bacterium G21597-S1]